MNARRFSLAMLASAVMLAGCSSTPDRNASLAEAQDAYQTARNDPQVIKYAHPELQRAEQRLTNAQNAWEENKEEDKVDHLAYLAKQQVEIAKAVATREAAEQTIATAESQREQIRLQARTREIESAQLQAQQATQRAEQAEQRAQQMEKELQDLNAKQTDRGVSISLGDVLFATGSADLTAEGVRNVEKVADYLRNNPDRKVLVEGFTDSVGAETFNQQLSERRANSVKRIFLRAGVDSSRIETIGYGESYPIGSNDNAGGRQLNRRVEVIIGDPGDRISER